MADSHVNIEIIDRKGGKVLLYSGHQYHKKKAYKNKSILWRCANNRKLKCTGYLTINVSVIYVCF